MEQYMNQRVSFNIMLVFKVRLSICSGSKILFHVQFQKHLSPVFEFCVFIPDFHTG
jgi:hypothetical protein